MKREWWAAGAAFLLLASACAPPKQTSTNHNVAAVESPSPSPSPTASTAFAGSSPGFHGGEVGIGYAPVALTATGGVQPYHWSVSTGGLPPGVSLGNDGRLTGTPSAAGTFAFSIQASDSGDGTATIPGTIKVAPHLTAALLPACAQSCNVELGCASACGAFGTFSGGVPPYGFTLVQGPLPLGTTLSQNALTLNGTFGGQTGYLQFTVQVGDAFGATARVSPTFWIYPHLSLAGGTCQGRGLCQMALIYSGGTPNQKVVATAAAWVGDKKCGYGTVPLPCPQPTFSATYQPGQIALTLTYAAGAPATFGTFTVSLTSTDLCGPGVHCTAATNVTVIG